MKKFENSFKNIRSIIGFCEICGSKFHGYNAKQKTCKCCILYVSCNNCGKNFIKDHNNIGIDIINNLRDYEKLNLFCCNKCQRQKQKFYCLKCNNEIQSKLSKCNECGYIPQNDYKFKDNGMKYCFCNYCNCETLHNGIICCKCSPNSQSGIIPQFKTLIENNKKIMQYYDIDSNDYVPWENYKEKLKIFQNCKSEIVNDYPNVRLIPTFRLQDSVDWTGSRLAFEQSLIESEVTWFVYIKFEQNFNPLVVGKSGSLLVNSNGSDVSFSTHEDHGPARKFLIEEKLEWDKTKILIIPCKSKEDALIIEKEIHYKYKLFYS